MDFFQYVDSIERANSIHRLSLQRRLRAANPISEPQDRLGPAQWTSSESLSSVSSDEARRASFSSSSSSSSFMSRRRPPLPPSHYRTHRAPYYPGELYTSRYSSLHLRRDPLSNDYLEKRPLDKGLTRSQSLYNSRGVSDAQSRDIESPVHRDSPRSKMTRSQSMIPTIERHSSSSPTFSEDEDDDDSPFESPTRLREGTTIQHTSLMEERDPDTAELLNRGMKRTQSRLATILPAIWRS